MKNVIKLNSKMKPEICQHFWFQVHVVYEGRTKNEVGVVRYCKCGAREMAFTKGWKKLPGNYDSPK